MDADPIAAASHRSGGRSVQDLFDLDSRPVPAVLRMTGTDADLGHLTVGTERYTSRDWAAREDELLWRRVWQIACHESEIPEVGDHVVYEIAGRSLIVLRSTATQIRAFHNSCLHRGTKLRETSGTVHELRCPFHGWSWSLDGDLRDLPCAWDLGHVDHANYKLPEVRVESWLGLVFVNQDPDAPSLSSFLGGLTEHFAEWGEHAFGSVTAYVSRVVPANWKVALEAFIESYHVSTTHPQQRTYIADWDAEYDVYPGEPHFNRMITAVCTPGPSLDYDVTEEELSQDMAEQSRIVGDDAQPIAVPDGTTARTTIAGVLRARLVDTLGPHADTWSDAELLDGIEYFVFPNFQPWFGARNHYAYRFLPHGDDPNCSLMELYLFAFRGDAEARTHPIVRRQLTQDEPFTAAPELGRLAEILEQDWINMIRVQQGLQSAAHREVTFTRYQESRIRHFHQTLDRYLAGEWPTGRSDAP